ncbi:MAG: hypothetical protein HYR90_01585 [Candidatus Andersenbacteria bacterium]|nr:hypothetical protein [Candidatus Andersenbacteria bacterium]MBI3250850.1 hypothetical protein [Candidatus Andersenbacteria bacterium]
MTDHEHHNELLQGLSDQLKEIFEESNQAIYLYLDDAHKICNQKFADLLGYASTEAWAEVTEPFPQVFVNKNSQEALIDAFQKAMELKAASTTPITWKKQTGEMIDTTVIIVPISYQGHLFALHFVTANN